MRAAVAAALIALVTVLAVGCSPGGEPDRESARKGGSVTVALPVAPDSLDPAVAADPEALRALWLVHTPPLTFRHAEGQAGLDLRPGLAQALPDVADDGRELSFELRRGLRYSDGRPVAVGDFERAIKRALVLHPRGKRLFGEIVGAREYARHPEVGVRLAGIESNARTRKVTIRLTAPDPAFPAALALPMAAPVPAGTDTRDHSGDPPPGVGSYRLGDERPDRAFTLLRERAPEGLPDVPAGNADEIVAQVVEDPAAATRETTDGGVDVFEGEAPRVRLPEIRSKYKDRYREDPTLAVDSVRLDTTRPPFDDRGLRRAVGFALDETVMTRLSDGFLTPTCNVIAPQVPGYAEADPCPFGDPNEAPDLVQAQDLVQRAPPIAGQVLVSAGDVPYGRALERYVTLTLRKIGIRASVARGTRERAEADVVLGRSDPGVPAPGGYFSALRQRVLAGRVALLTLDGNPREAVDQWSAIERSAVDGGLLIPYGVETDGVLLSERLDATNCRSYNPLYGLDYSSLCLR